MQQHFNLVQSIHAVNSLIMVYNNRKMSLICWWMQLINRSMPLIRRSMPLVSRVTLPTHRFMSLISWLILKVMWTQGTGQPITAKASPDNPANSQQRLDEQTIHLELYACNVINLPTSHVFATNKNQHLLWNCQQKCFSGAENDDFK